MFEIVLLVLEQSMVTMVQVVALGFSKKQQLHDGPLEMWA